MKVCIVLQLLCLQSALALRVLQAPNELPDEDTKSALEEIEFSKEEVESWNKEAEDAFEALQSFEPSETLVAGWVAALQKKQLSANKGFHKSQMAFTAKTLPEICQNDVREKKLQHAECADPWSKTMVCQNPYEIPEYRLGDTFFGHFKPGETYEYMRTFFPNSIAAKYLQNKKKNRKDIEALLQIVDGPDYQAFEKPSSNEMVVHLRLGDVDWSMPDSNYSKIAQTAKQQGLDTVVLVTGEHKFKQRADLGMMKYPSNEKGMASRMRRRVQHLEYLFKRAGFKVTSRVNYNADCDFVYMVNAPMFVKSDGSFSALVEKVIWWRKTGRFRKKHASKM